MNDKATFNEANTATSILRKISDGQADPDFARAVQEAVQASLDTGGKSEVTIKVKIKPNTDRGSLFMDATVTKKIPIVNGAATQMHVGEDGAILTQQEIWMQGGANEDRARTAAITGERPRTAEIAARPSVPALDSPSGRHPVVKPGASAPIAAPNPPAPIKGEAAADGAQQ